MKATHLLIISIMMLLSPLLASANNSTCFQYISVGRIQHKDKWVFAIPFVNNTNRIVSINRAQPSCQCISVSYPREPLKPKLCKYIYLSVKFGKEKKGRFQKSLFINLSNKDLLIIKVRGELF